MTVRQWAALAAVLAAAAALYLLPVGRRVLYHQDEARFAILARQAVEEGRWLLPVVRGHVYLNKPPYYFWAVAALALPFGRVDETTAPLVSVVAALATLAATFAIARRLWGWDVGLTAVLALATAPFFFAMAHQVLSDMLLTAWLTWALYLYVRLVGDGAPAPRWVLPAFYLCVGGGLGTKGPAALIVVLAAIAASLATDGGAGVRRLRLGLGAALIGLTALPWLLPYLLQHDGSYTRDVVVGHYAEWYFRSKPTSRLDRLGENLAGVLPWILFLGLAPWWWWRTWGDRARLRVIVWAAVIGIGVSLSGEQRARYFLPVDPLLALLVAEILVGSVRVRAGRRLVAAAVALGVIACVAGAAVVWAPGRLVRGRDTLFLPTTRAEAWLLAGLAATAWLLALLALARGAGGALVAVGIALGLGGMLAVIGVNYPPRYSRERTMAPFAEQVRAAVPPDVTIWAYPEASLAYDLHLRRQVREIDPPYRVFRRLHDPAVRALLTRQEHWWYFQGAVDPAWGVAASGRIEGQTMLLLRRGS